MNELELKLQQLQAELKAHFEKAAEQDKTRGSISEELKTAIANLQKQVDAIDKSLTEKHTQNEPRTFDAVLKENDSIQRLVKDGSGKAIIELKGADYAAFERKTLIDSTAVGAATSGVLQIDRTGGIVQEARRQLRIRQLLSTRPTSMQVLDFVKVNASPVKGSPQTEGSAKLENAATFTTASEKVKTIATWIPATRQILDDFAELGSYLQTALPYYVDLEEEGQLLTGDGAGENLHSLTHQATAFNTALLGSGSWSQAELIARAIQQIEVANEVQPTFVALNPADYWSIRLAKTSTGEYIFGNPAMDVGNFQLFGLTAVRTTAMAATKFLIGSGNSVAAEIRDRMSMKVEISTEHSTYFTENKIAIRAEKRLALVMYRPASFIYGTFSTSPA